MRLMVKLEKFMVNNENKVDLFVAGLMTLSAFINEGFWLTLLPAIVVGLIGLKYILQRSKK